ncbi:hypothetical protein SAMN05421878_102125 [Actinobaculum suis]|uniref:Uncharacterized protein n=1 Tax=Actinobaculum suis TaxID=1657 RepID=A0A1G7A9J5_9ACTO|nr:hypothetical protein [Actinobaculum suis]MDY5152647.1 hypothetical protein [Actinobaculum suis]SDE11157.1 hypothetical protein SAMN05421878_102125 [Actinobaculum suis]
MRKRWGRIPAVIALLISVLVALPLAAIALPLAVPAAAQTTAPASPPAATGTNTTAKQAPAAPAALTGTQTAPTAQTVPTAQTAPTAQTVPTAQTAPTAQTGAAPVVIIGASGLEWEQLTEENAPHLLDFQTTARAANVVVRGASRTPCPAEGWLTLGAGARAKIDGPCTALSGPEANGTIPGWAELTSAHIDNDAVPLARLGALAQVADPEATLAAGPGAALALAREGVFSGTYLDIDSTPASSALASQVASVLPGKALAVFDLGVVNPPAAPASTAEEADTAPAGNANADAEKTALAGRDLAEIDRRFSEVLQAVETAAPQAQIIVTGVGQSQTAEARLGYFAMRSPGSAAMSDPAAVSDSAGTTSSATNSGAGSGTDAAADSATAATAAAADSATATGPGLAYSKATRTYGLVQLTDIAPTLATQAAVANTSGAAPAEPLLSAGKATDKYDARTTVYIEARKAHVSQRVAPAARLILVVLTMAVTVLGLARIILRRPGDGSTGFAQIICWVAAIPAGSLLVNLLPWWYFNNPQLSLLVCIALCAAIIAVFALWTPQKLRSRIISAGYGKNLIGAQSDYAPGGAKNPHRRTPGPVAGLLSGRRQRSVKGRVTAPEGVLLNVDRRAVYRGETITAGGEIDETGETRTDESRTSETRTGKIGPATSQAASPATGKPSASPTASRSAAEVRAEAAAAASARAAQLAARLTARVSSWVTAPLVRVAAITFILIAADLLQRWLFQPSSSWMVSSVFGMHPALGARYYGLPNTMFALLTVGGLAIAAWLARLFVRRGERRRAVGAVVVMWAVTICLDALPFLGADFGGAPAITLGFAALAIGYAAGKRFGWLAAGGAIVAGGLISAGIAVLDRLLGASTHLGVFAATASHGGLERVVARKLQAMFYGLDPRAGAVLLVVIAAAIVLGAWLISRGKIRWPRHPLLAAFALAWRDTPLGRAVLTASVLALLLGSLMNDSGFSIAGFGACLLLPLWVLMVERYVVAVSVADADADAEASAKAGSEANAKAGSEASATAAKQPGQ